MARITIVIIVLVLIGSLYVAFRAAPDPIVPRIDLSALESSIKPFQAPKPGDRIRIELVTGAARDGSIRHISEDSVVIETAHGEVTYPRRNIAPGSRRLLFHADSEGIAHDLLPTTFADEELVRLLSSDDVSMDDLGFAHNVQYVISGTNAIIIYGSHEAR